MLKVITVMMLGLCSSVAMAQSMPEGGRDDDSYSYECKFEDKCDDKVYQCRVEGLICKEYDTLDGRRRCEGYKDPVKISCNYDSFELDARDSAVKLEDGTLWINAKERSKIATIAVEDFKDNHDMSYDDFHREADLLFSKKEGKADRLKGFCKFKKIDRRGHGPDATLQ